MPAVYFLFRIIAWFVSWLPFPLLYLLSDLLYLKLYYIFRYRRKVVYSNLRNAFPEKTDPEIRLIALKFYRHLADVVLEVIKLRSMSGRKLVERLHFTNLSLIQDVADSGQSVIGAMGHIGNWEWMPIGLQRILTGMQGFAVVKPLSDKFFDAYYNKIRCRLLINSELISFKHIFRELVRHKNEVTYTALAADQTPHKDEIHYWTRFLNQDTAFFQGVEKMAVKLNLAVFFLDVQQTRRGYYEVTATKITVNPADTSPNEIMESYIQLLENAIRTNPHNWLWSHRRWKYKREEKEERRYNNEKC